jgi:hypothetical protein
MSRSDVRCAKILSHDAGLGIPDPEMVRQRAREIARINGRDPRHYSEADWLQAKLELHGGHELDGDEPVRFFSGHDPAAGSTGHQAPKLGSDELENIGEELIAEGMEEALHERMVRAVRLDT